MRNIKKAGIIIFILLSLSTLLVGYRKFRVDKIAELTDLHRLDLEYPITTYELSKSTLLYTNRTSAFSYNYETRKSNKLYTAVSNQELKLSDKRYLCVWENYQINSKDEIATSLKVIEIVANQLSGKPLTNEIGSFSTNLTIQPVSCNDKEVYAEDYYPNSLNRKYKIDLVGQNIVEVQKLITQIEKSDQPIIKVAEKTNGIVLDYEGISYNLKYPNIFIKANYTNKGFILTDNAGELWFVTIPNN